MKNKLPLEYPPITSYPLIANMMSVLWSYKQDTLPWISDRFIQLLYREEVPPFSATNGVFYEYELSYNRPMFLSCPFLYVSRFDRLIFSECNSCFLDFLKRSINDGYYLHLGLNHQHLSCSPSYNRYFVHPTFIYGYNEPNNEIFIRDFFKNTYCDEIANYDEVNAAFYDIDYGTNAEYLNYISMFKYRSIEYSHNIDKVVLDYTDYLNSVDSRNVFNEDYIYKKAKKYYGLSYYDALSDSFNNRTVDIRSFHVLIDHKTMQKIRIEYLNSVGSLKNVDKLLQLNEELTSMAKVLQNLALKFLITKKNEVILNGIAFCKKMKERDTFFVNLFIESIL